MDFKDVVIKRRSIRKYTDEPVSEEDLQYILECGMSAPSAVNLQPWYFVVIRSKEQMARLCEVMSDSSDKLSDDLHALFKSHPEVVEETLSFLRKLGGAPIVILAFRHKPSYPKKDDAIVQSVSAALENIALAAVDRGLGSCWMTAPMETADDTRLREMFAPECGEMVALMTIGHPAQDPRPIPHKKGRYVII